ncbi:MAG: Hsp20/alpha crystallin family protein [Formivibrio sp.]|nr:Hsp20/alpha crystallin family protein [Formivibrio sp.]
MANIIRRNLDTLLDDPLRSVDDLFRGFFVRPVEYEGGPRISLDVKEDDKAYTVHADLPGVKKENIDVQVEGNMVRISAESRQEKEEKKGEKVIRSERYVGRVSRSFTLGVDVDETAATAKFENGVLELTLPKKPMPEPRRKLTIE